MENYKKMKAIFIIINAGFSDEAVDIARACGANGATILNARGTGNKFKSFLGISYDPEKEMVLSLVEEDVAEKIMEEIHQKIGANTSASGICFCMPVDKATLLNKNDGINNI